MKKRKELTAEQIAARDARRSRFRDLARKVSKMSDAERAALMARLPAVVSIEGRPLSPFNSCLIAYQNPQASLVGGFRQWLAHGRAVRKGEHGAMIWIPAGNKDTGATSAPAEGGERPGFITGTVFSVEQTYDLAAGDGEAIDVTTRGPAGVLAVE